MFVQCISNLRMCIAEMMKFREAVQTGLRILYINAHLILCIARSKNNAGALDVTLTLKQHSAGWSMAAAELHHGIPTK